MSNVKCKEVKWPSPVTMWKSRGCIALLPPCGFFSHPPSLDVNWGLWTWCLVLKPQMWYIPMFHKPLFLYLFCGWKPKGPQIGTFRFMVLLFVLQHCSFRDSPTVQINERKKTPTCLVCIWRRHKLGQLCSHNIRSRKADRSGDPSPELWRGQRGASSCYTLGTNCQITCLTSSEDVQTVKSSQCL